MAREIVESVRIVIKTDCGNRMAVEGKGSAARGMLTAFSCLPETRRTWLLEKMQKEHADMLAREAARLPITGPVPSDATQATTPKGAP